jgi:hypothetical protein
MTVNNIPKQLNVSDLRTFARRKDSQIPLEEPDLSKLWYIRINKL